MAIKIALIGMVFYSASSFAFTLGSSTNSSLKGWNGGEVQFVINTTNCPSNVDINGIVDDAIKVWNNVANSNLKVSRGGSSTAQATSNPPVIWCSTSFSTASGGADPNFVAGVGLFGYSNNVIDQGQIILNAQSGANANIGNMNATSLKVIVAHEMGHVLGLGHSEYSAALMYYDASAKTDFNLSQDDIDGISYLYPRDEIGHDKMMGCGIISGANFNGPKNGQNLWLSLLALALPLLIWLRLRFIWNK